MMSDEKVEFLYQSKESLVDDLNEMKCRKANDTGLVD